MILKQLAGEFGRAFGERGIGAVHKFLLRFFPVLQFGVLQLDFLLLNFHLRDEVLLCLAQPIAFGRCLLELTADFL